MNNDKNLVVSGMIIGGLITGFVSLVIACSIISSLKNLDKELHNNVLQSSIELKWSSPTEIKQIFLVSSNPDVFMCDTDTGNGTSIRYYTHRTAGKMPRVGEWWDLAINENGDKVLYIVDWDKTKKENGGELP